MLLKRALSAVLLSLTALSLQGCFTIAATGVGATALMIDDRRSAGFQFEDENIEWRVRGLIIREFKEPHVNVTSFNLNVLITGEVPTEKMKAEIGEAVRKVQHVKNVSNELVVAGNSSFAARTGDTLTTSNVKARFLTAKGFSANHVKVVTEAGTVFLMGLVTKEEADLAVEVARTTSGVQRVVKVFEDYSAPAKK